MPYFLLPSLGSGSTLRGYSSWRFRDRHAMLLSGEWRWIPNRMAIDMAFFYDTGMVAPRLDAITFGSFVSDFGVGMRFHSPHGHATPHRVRERVRRLADRVRRELGVLIMSTSLASRVPTRALRHPRRCVSAARRRRAPLLRRRPADAGARDSGRVEGQRVGDRSDHRSRHEPVRPPGRLDAERARQEHQHDRRGAGFELVHQSPADESRDSRRGVARPAHRHRAGTGPLESSCRGSWPASRRDSRCGTRANDLWFVSFDAAGHPEAATGAIIVANKLFWALGYWQVENYLVSVTPDQILISDKATFTPASGRERRMEQRDLDDVFKRAHRSADGSYRAVAARARARASDRRVQLPRHASRRPERRRAPRAPARAESAEGVRRVDQPRGHEGREHARHRRRRERPQRRAPLPAGRRVHVWYRRQRSSRVRRRLGTALRRRADAKAPGRVSASSSSRGRRRSMSKTPPSGDSRATASIPRDGGHASGQPRSSTHGPTTTSGPLDASRRSPTT